MVIAIVVLALILSAFVALYIWTRRSESGIEYEHQGLSDDEGNALRFGIALGANAKNSQ